MLISRGIPTALTVAALAIHPGSASSQAPGRQPVGPKKEVGPIPAGAQDRAALLRLEDGWAAALPKRDRAYFEKTLDSAFIYTEDAKLMSRAQVLSDLLTGSDVVTTARNDGMVVHLFGSSTGVVTGLLIVEGRSGKKPFVKKYRFTDTWVKQPDGSWKIVAAQDYLVR